MDLATFHAPPRADVEEVTVEAPDEVQLALARSRFSKIGGKSKPISLKVDGKSVRLLAVRLTKNTRKELLDFLSNEIVRELVEHWDGFIGNSLRKRKRPDDKLVVLRVLVELYKYASNEDYVYLQRIHGSPTGTRPKRSVR